MDEERLLRIEDSLDVHDRTTNPYPPAPDGRWPLSVTARALLMEVRRLREQNRGLRVLLKSPYQGEYAYVSDAAIDAALAERDPAHERSSA